jgi:hypothetical protein
VFYNDTYGLATTTQSTVYQRIPQIFNLAVNGWLRTFVGARPGGVGGARPGPGRDCALVRQVLGGGRCVSTSRSPPPARPPAHPPARPPARPLARRHAAGNASANLLGVQEAPKATSSITLDFSSLLGPLFFTWVVQMLLPIFLMQLVYEKEKR